MKKDGRPFKLSPQAIRLLFLWSGKAGLAFMLAIPLCGAAIPPDEEPLAAFAQWMETFKQARATQKVQSANASTEGVRLAEARRPVMQRLIREQPARALNGSLRWRDWAGLPAEIQAEVEEPFSEVADFEVIPDCRPVSERQTPWQVYWLRMRGTNFAAFVSGRRQAMTSKLRIPAQGIILGGDVALWDAPVLPLKPEEVEEVAQRFPEGNPRSRSWLSGNPIGAKGRAGLIGGRVHHFGSDEDLAVVAEAIAGAERLLGPKTLEVAWGAATQGEIFDMEAFSRAAKGAKSQWTETPKRVLVLRLDFTTAEGTPHSYEQFAQTMARASDAIQVMSHGKTWIVPTITTQVLVLPNSRAYYGDGPTGALADAADQVAAENGYTLTHYDIRCYSAAGPWGAWGLVGGDRIWMRGSSGVPEVATHELGHTYGLWHANFWTPQTGLGLWSHYHPSGGYAIEHHEYGDQFDIMGGGIYIPTWAELHMNVNMKAHLNWLEPQNVMFASSNGVYRLRRFDEGSARAHPDAKLALRISNRASDEFWVSLRGGNSTKPRLANGAVIVWTPNGPGQHELLDATPLSAPNRSFDSDRDDCMLPPGGSWTDPTSSFRIRNLGRGGASPAEYLDLEVTHFPTLSVFEFYTTTNQTTPGLTASFVNQSLAGYAPQNDWRESQTISGTRVDPSLSFRSNSWGARASVGLTHGSDADWDSYSVQWDGYLIAHRPMRLKISSSDSSRMWIDLNNDGVFAAAAPEFTDNGWSNGPGGRISPASTTIPPGAYHIRVQYEAGVTAGTYANYFSVLTMPVEFEFFTTSALSTPGLQASFVNQNLRSYALQDDWRTSQVISGSRVDVYPGQTRDGWGPQAEVGLTGGSDGNWELFSAQWDGWLHVFVPTVLATASDDGSRMWIDVDGNGDFSASAPELINNNWGSVQGTTFGANSVPVPTGIYKFRIQYEEGGGGNALVAYGRPTPLSAWLAFNDGAPGIGTHPDATAYGIFGAALSSAGKLNDVRSGDELSATLNITRSSAGVSPGVFQSQPAVGSPLRAVFAGYVDFSSDPKPDAALTNGVAWVTYTFNGLNPAQRYSFKGGAVGPQSGGTNGWTLCELAGAESFLPAHSSSRVLTTTQAPGLSAAQAILNTGGNQAPRAGDYVGWDAIHPGDDGSFAVTCQLYGGALPGGLRPDGTAYALTALRLEEFVGPARPVEIVAVPLSQEILAGQGFTLSVQATGTPLFYQWYKDGVALAGANFSSLRVAGTTTNDTGRYFVVVSNQFNSVPSAVAAVGVYPDAITAVFRIMPLAGVTNGPFPLRVTGVAAKGNVVVETSTNFTEWAPVLTNWCEDPTFDFTDSAGATNPVAFYRARIPGSAGPANQLPSVAIMAPDSGSSFSAETVIMITAAATDPEGSPLEVRFFANGEFLAADLTPPYVAYWNPTEGSYELLASASDSQGGTTLSDPVTVTITPRPPPPGTYFETNGLVVIEGEHFAISSSGAFGHAWQARTDQAGYVGDMAMQALPNAGSNITANIQTTSPYLIYRVSFATQGTRNLWIRGWAASGGDDSVHVGLNGQGPQTLIYSQTGTWVWRSRQIVIPSAARHEINVWMREDGAYLDRLLLTTNLAFTPTGDGPPESMLPGANTAPLFYEWFPPYEDWPPNLPITVAPGESLAMGGKFEDDVGGIYTCVWTSDRGPIETQSKLVPGAGGISSRSQISYTPTAADLGVRTITLKVLDPGGLTATNTWTLTVTNLPPGAVVTAPRTVTPTPTPP